MKIIEEPSRLVMIDETRDGAEIGELTWVNETETTFEVNHTLVDPAYRGRGLAGKLFMAAVARARRENKKIIPTCSYAVAAFERLPELADVLDKK